MAAVGCAFVAEQDNPSVGLRGFAKSTLVSMIIVAAYSPRNDTTGANAN